MVRTIPYLSKGDSEVGRKKLKLLNRMEEDSRDHSLTRMEQKTFLELSILTIKQLLGWHARVPTNLDEYYVAPEDRLYRSGQG